MQIMKITWFIFHSLSLLCMSFLPKQGKCCTKLTRQFCFTPWGIPPSSLPSAYWWVRKDWKEKEVYLPYLSLSFYGIISAWSSWLIQGKNMNKKECERIPWSLFWFRGQMESMASRMSAPPSPPPYLVAAVTYFPSTCFESVWMPMFCGPLKLCAHGAFQMLYVNGKAKYSGHLFYSMSMLHHPIGLHFQTISSVKILRIRR